MYRIRFRESARDEFQYAKDYGLAERIVDWLKNLAESAERGRNINAIDFRTFLEEGIESLEAEPGTLESNWKTSLRRFWEVENIDKLRALLHVVRHRSAPWQMAASVAWFGGILGHLDAEVHVYYEIDHVEKQLVVVMLTGLPGQGQ